MILKYLILGIIQGITEPIPVSSSGHLLIIEKLFNLTYQIDFETLATVTNLGSFIAIIILFKKQIIILFKSFINYIKTKQKKYYPNYKYCLLLILGTIPAGLLGIIVIKLNIFNVLENNIKFIGFMLIVTGFFLFIIKDFKGKKENENITFKDALIIGLFQAAALLPGISRSGATIVGSMLKNLKRETAFNFSFLLYIPISIITSIIGIKDLINTKFNHTLILYIESAIMAFVFTYFATKWFKSIIIKGKLIYFTYYCLIIGILVILFV